MFRRKAYLHVDIRLCCVMFSVVSDLSITITCSSEACVLYETSLPKGFSDCSYIYGLHWSSSRHPPDRSVAVKKSFVSSIQSTHRIETDTTRTKIKIRITSHSC